MRGSDPPKRPRKPAPPRKSPKPAPPTRPPPEPPGKGCDPPNRRRNPIKAASTSSYNKHQPPVGVPPPQYASPVYCVGAWPSPERPGKGCLSALFCGCCDECC